MAITRKRPTLPKLNGKPSGPKPKHGQPRRDATPKAQPADAKKKEDGATEKRGKWGKKPKTKVDEDADDSGYDEAPAASDDEDGFNFDLTSSLAGPPAMSRFKTARSTPASSNKANGGRSAAMEVEEEEAAEEEMLDDDEDAEIMAMMGKKSFKDGATVAKAAVGKGKGKEAKTMVGGGSWQSMGKLVLCTESNVSAPDSRSF